MNTRHPSFRNAHSQLRAVFGKLKNDSYISSYAFSQALNEWLDQWENCIDTSKLNKLDKIHILVKLLRNEEVTEEVRFTNKSIITASVKHAVQNIQKRTTLNSLFQISKLPKEISQGTLLSSNIYSLKRNQCSRNSKFFIFKEKKRSILQKYIPLFNNIN